MAIAVMRAHAAVIELLLEQQEVDFGVGVIEEGKQYSVLMFTIRKRYDKVTELFLDKRVSSPTLRRLFPDGALFSASLSTVTSTF